MSININGVLLIEAESTQNFIVKKLSIDDDGLGRLSKDIELPSQNRLPEYELGIENVFTTSTRFKISDLKETSYLYFLKELLDECYEKNGEIEYLKSLDELLPENTAFNPNIVIYEVKEIGKKESYFLVSEFKKNMLIKNQTYFFGKKNSKMPDSDIVKIKALENTDYFVLPQKNFICSLHEYSDDNDRFEVRVYKAIELDNIFSLESLIKEYAEKKIKRFIDTDDKKKFKLTRSHADVYFKSKEGKNKEDDVINAVLNSQDMKLIKTFADFTGRGNKTIQQIDLFQLEDVMNQLKAYANDPRTDNLFELDEIPEIDVNNKCVYVYGQSIKIFAAILSNEIIKKLLDGKIEIPYYIEE